MQQQQQQHATNQKGGSVGTFLGELGWRDYAQNVILQMPDYACENARERFDKMPWRNPNRGHLIAETINSVLGQCYAPFQIVVLDDGSTTGKLVILGVWCSREKNGGWFTLTHDPTSEA